MNYFIEDLKNQLQIDLNYLKTTYPELYLYPDNMITNMYIGYEPTDGTNYIVMHNIGEQRTDIWSTHKYTVNTKIVLKSSQGYGINAFSYMCKGISDRLYLIINRKLTNFKIVNIVKYDYNPIRIENHQYQCEIIFDFYVDTLTIPGDITQEYFEEVD